jgi:hypothetical protein
MENSFPDPTQLPGLTRYMSFVDESGHGKDPNQRHLCLAGLLATEHAWKKFDVEWRMICAAAALTKPFHMKDFAARRGDFAAWKEEQRQQLLLGLISTIRRARAIPIGSVVSIEGFNALPPQARRGFRDPHFLAFQSLTYHIAVAAGMHMEPGPVTMVYAHHPEHSGGLGNTGQLWEAVREYTPWIAMFMESYLSGQQSEYPGLQAADLWAYELRHHFDVIRPAGQKPRWPFIQFVGLGLNYDFTHDFISYHDEDGLSGLGKMSRVQRWGEIDLYKPGFVGLAPSAARNLDKALRNFTENLNRQTKARMT